MFAARTYARLVKFEHSVFALPFAYVGLGWAVVRDERALSVALVACITVAMVAARTLAMAFNRLADAAIDARNPRTADREIPAGVLSKRQVGGLCVLSLVVLVACTTQLAPITRVLWPLPVALFIAYPYAKRVTWLCHAVLGLSIGLAVAAAWIATGASAAHAAPWLLTGAIACWIGGFDIYYALADRAFDQAHNIHSVPARWGARRAVRIVWCAHALSVACFAAAIVALDAGVVSWCALSIGGLLLAREAYVMRDADLTRLDHAFFTLNSWVGVIIGVGMCLDAWRAA